MKTMLKTAALAAGLALAAPLAAQTLPPAVIVVVDMDRVFNTSAAGKTAQGELKTRLEGIQTRLQTLRTQLTTEQQTLVKSRPTAAGPALTAWETKARDLQTRSEAAEKELGQRDRDFQASRQNVLRQLNDGPQPIISAIMRERGASIALAEGATLQHTAAIDVTTDVIARLDKSLPRVSTATPAAPAPAPAATPRR